MSPTLRKLLAAELLAASPVGTEASNKILACMRVAANVEVAPQFAIEAHRAAWSTLLFEVESAGGQMNGEDIGLMARGWLKIPRAAKALQGWSLATSDMKRADLIQRRSQNGTD